MSQRRAVAISLPIQFFFHSFCMCLNQSGMYCPSSDPRSSCTNTMDDRMTTILRLLGIIGSGNDGLLYNPAFDRSSINFNFNF
jgi:hypothetical protein